ncbi:hypothetical protein JCM8547_005550 [Rhodosporidiobolus lusitaniae]
MTGSKASSVTLEASPTSGSPVKRVWYRSTWWCALALGVANFCAPGLWGACNSIGAGGLQEPWTVNAANALTFSLMVVTAFATSAITRVVGVRWTLFFGGAGYAVYTAALYVNSTQGTQWFLLLGAALCGLSAGTFWAIEAAIAMSYPEPYNIGKFFGWWLSFRVLGQILGGAINLGINARNSQAGSINPQVYIVFIVLQCLGPFSAFLLPPPNKVQRTDGQTVKLYIDNPLLVELRETAKLFFSKKFLLIVPLIVQAVFSESFNSTFLTLHYSVRARALGSFLSAVCCITSGQLFGLLIDSTRLNLKKRARYSFVLVLGLQGAWWIWSVVIDNEFRKSSTIYDWSDAGFGKGFASYLSIAVGFQLNYMYLYFVAGSLVSSPADIVRIGGLLRATESAAQAVSYGLNSLKTFQAIGASALNFALWGVALLPAWLVVRKIGVEYYGRWEDENGKKNGDEVEEVRARSDTKEEL